MKSGITFIIVTWNNEDEILPCLDSIKKYSPRTSEIIVVDNHSSDKTVDRIQKEYPDVRLIASKENLGFAKGNNLALEYVATEYICYLNPDVILTEDIVLPSIEALERDSSVGLVACRLNNPDGSHQPSCFQFATSKTLFSEILHLGALVPRSVKKRFFANHYVADDLYYPDWVIGAEMVLRTAEAKAVEGFSTEYFMYTEDMDLCKKISTLLSKRILFLPTVSLIHIGGASEAQNLQYDKQKKLFENDLLFVTKFYGRDEAHQTHKKMILAYRIRLLLLGVAYWKADRTFQLTKTKQSLKILQEMQ